MKQKTVIAIALIFSFGLGFAVHAAMNENKSDEAPLKRATSIGGIFFKCNEPKKVREWYAKHLGLNVNQYGSVFEWRHATDSAKKGFTQWSPFKNTTKYFEPSTKDFMINYRVADLGALIGELKKEGVTILDTMASYEYGKFVHILDLEGNKIELWEPNDIIYEKMGNDMGSTTTK